MAIIIEEPLQVYAGSEWNLNITLKADGEPIDFSVYNEIVVTWRVREYNPVNKMILESPRDQNAEGTIKIRTTAEQTANMHSNGVFDVFGDTQIIVKGYTQWEEKVK